MLSTCMIGGMMPLPASAEETVSENIVQTECIENTENLENAPSEDEKSSETDHETGSETESETVTDAETEGTAISAIQALIDALPDADSITEDNVENVTSQLDTIDEAKAELSDADISQLDLTRYDAAINKVMVLMGMKEENDSEIAVQANDSAGKTEQQSTDEAIVYQPAVETTDKYDIDDDGEKETVYEISNAGQLYWFAGLVNGTLDGVEQNTLANAVLTANITVNENLLDSLQYDTEGNVSNGSDFISWTPIADWMGNRTTQYSGTFDGNNKTVSGLYFNGDSTCIGLFGSSESDGNIKNVGVVDSYFKGNDHVGGVCGNNAGTITNCYNAGNLTAIESSATIGGICGYNNGGTVTNCYNTGTVTATGSVASVGGVCGCSTAPISNCYNIGTVTAASSDADISGICGYNFGPIKNCYYLADTEDENGGKTTEQFASGEVAYLLSQGCSTEEGDYDGSIWGQKLGENGDTYPVLDITKRVYQVDKYDGCEGKPGSSTKVYSNQNTSIYEEHKYEEDATDSTKHKCSICNGTEEHSFAYEFVENGNAIKATCSECGATYTVKLTQPAETSDEKIVYDGTEKKAGTAIDFGNTGIETIPENAITYAVVTNGTPSTYSTAAPKNAGTYKAKLTLGTGDNRVSIEINFTIEKAASPTIAGEEKSYAYSAGSGGKAIGVDIAGKLPTDRGTTTYAVAKTDTEQLLSEVAVDTAGNLTYKVNQVDSSKVGKTAIITVTASMENYENVEYTLTIRSITDKKTVEIKRGNTVSVDGSNALTYGDKLSKLSFSSVTFVEADTDTEVTGTLKWADPDCMPTAGTTQAGWVFKPADSKHYEDLTGTAAITVAKATPIVVTVPTVAEREYNPDAALTGSDMTGGSVTGADGNSLAGTWSFTGTNIVPTVNNTGYQAVFTPNDTNNYNTVTRTITVKVTKATPVIAEKPTAGALTYGQKLSDSTLTGGKAAYQTADGTEITGTFAWKNDTTKPAVVDSQKTKYDVTFTPSDKDNYNAVDTKLTLSINKAAAPAAEAGSLTITNGLHKTYSLDLSALLPKLESPKKYGEVTYELGTDAISFTTAGYYDATKGNAEVKGDKLILPIQAVETNTTGNIGSVKVKVSTTNYHDFTLTVNVSAANKIVPVLDGKITASEITYGDTLSKSNISGTMKDDGNTVEGTFEWTNPSTKPDKAGDYQAEWTFTPAAGYEKYATATGTVTIKVNKATIPADAITAPAANALTYNGNDQALITAGMTDHGTMQYSLTENGTYSQDIPTGTDAGTYNVWYRVFGDANHNDTAPASVAVRIGKKPLRITGVTAASKPYDGTTSADISSVTFDGVNLNRGTDYTVTANFDDAGVGSVKSVTATVTLIGPAAKNYSLEQSSFPTTGSIIKATAPDFTKETALAIINSYKKTYTVTLPALPKLETPKEYGAPTYELGEIKLNGGYYTDGAKVENGKLTLPIQKNDVETTGSVGTVTVVIKSINYEDITLTVKVSAVNQIKPVPVDTITAAKITYGDTLSKSKISGTMKDPTTGDAVNGTFAWTDGTIKPDANDNYEAEWTFTPDAPEYATVTGKVTVEVAPKSIEGATITLEKREFTYNAAEQSPKITGVTLNGWSDTINYRIVSGDKATNANDSITLTIEGTGNYTGTATAKWKIIPAELTVSVQSVEKAYDGTTNATVTPTFNGLQGGENLTAADYSVTAAFEDAKVGYKKLVTGKVTLNQTDTAKNYLLKNDGTFSTGEGTIKKADAPTVQPVELTIYNDVQKDYFVDLPPLPELGEGKSYGTVSYSDKHTITLSDGYTAKSTLVADPENLKTYRLLLRMNQTGSLTEEIGTVTIPVTTSNYQDITLTVKVNAVNQITPVPDDGTITATPITYGNELSASTITGTMQDPNTGYAVNGTFTWVTPAEKLKAGSHNAKWIFTPDESNGGKYTTNTGTATVTVNPKAVTVSGITANDKVYDGNTNVVLDYSNAQFGGILGNDKLTVAAKGVFEKAEAGKQNVAISDLTLGGDSAANYVLAESGNQTETTATITAKKVTVTITSNGGTYGSVVAAAANLSGAVDGENVPVTLTYTGNGYNDTAVPVNAGSYTVTASIANSNYTLTGNTTADFVITPKAVTVSGITANDKVYDGTTDAVLDCSNAQFGGILGNDKLTVAAKGVFEKAEAGKQNVAISDLTLGGDSAANYVLAESGNQTETTATITAKKVTVTITPNGGTYGSVTAAAAKLTGAVKGENVPVTLTYTGNNYSSATVPVNVGSYTVTASIANSNYTLTGNTTADFVITPKAVTVSGITANDKVYDGNTNAVLDYSKVVLGGVLENDTLTVTATGTMESADVGEKKVTISNLTLGGDSAANYVLAESGNQTETTANITAKQITVTITPNGGTYGSVVAAAAKLSGAVAGENIPVTLTYTGNGYNDTAVPVNAGSYTVTVSISNSNYTLTGNTTADFVITPKAVTVSGITANDKVYDGTTDAVLDCSNAQFGGILGNDKLTVAAKGVFEKAEAGKQNVAISDLTLGGDSAANYVLAESGNQTETTATITAKEVTVTPDNKSKVYEEKDPDLTYAVSGVLDGETLKGITLARAEGENAGEYDITGTADAGANPNYNVTFAKGTFTIKPKSIQSATVVLGKGLAANGAEQTQTVEKVLLDGKELPADSYTVTGNTATAPGRHTLTITAKGNYTGTVDQTYVIVPAKAEDAPGEEIAIGSGKVKVNVKFEGTVPPATLLTDKAELLAMLVNSGDITADELAQIADGASVDIVLTVKEANVSAEIKTAMAQAAKDCTIGQYLDISLFKYMTVNGKQQDGVALHTTKNALTISVAVPDALINTNSAVNRTYCIVRNHEGTITVLDAAFNAASKTLTFKTDRFSDYAIAYKDTAVPSSGSNPGSNNSSNGSETKKNEVAAPTPAPTPASTSKPSTITAMPQTGDTSNPTLYVVLLVVSLLGLAVVFVCKKRNDK